MAAMAATDRGGIGQQRRPIAHRSWSADWQRRHQMKQGAASATITATIATSAEQRDARSGGGGGGGDEQRPIQPKPIAVRRWPEQCRRRKEMEAAAEQLEKKRIKVETAAEDRPARPRSSSLAMLEMDRARIKKEKALAAAAPSSCRELALASSPSGGARQQVKLALERFEAVRQELSAKKTIRPDAAAMKQMRLRGQWVNTEFQDYGHVPGVELFDVFSFRAELIIVGLHNHLQAGIGYLSESDSPCRVSIATSIVISGRYKDDKDDGDEFVYAGSGGNNSRDSKGKATDQELKRGNLALVNSVKRKTPVRVIRGRASACTPSHKQFRYDGLYSAVKYDLTVGANGCEVFKFYMKRCPGQPPLLPVEKNRRRR